MNFPAFDLTEYIFDSLDYPKEGQVVTLSELEIPMEKVQEVTCFYLKLYQLYKGEQRAALGDLKRLSKLEGVARFKEEAEKAFEAHLKQSERQWV